MKRLRALLVIAALCLMPAIGRTQDTISADFDLNEETDDVMETITSISPDSLFTLRQRLTSTIDSLNNVRDALDVVRNLLDSSSNEISTLTRRLDITTHHRDSLLITNERYQKELHEKNALLEGQVKALQEKELLFAEKEELYKKAITSNDIDKAKFEGEIQSKNISIEAKAREIAYLQRDLDSKAQTLTAQKEDYERLTKERDRYRHIVDSLRTLVRAAELENVRKDEANKYLAQRAKEAEDKVQAATNKKKKVRPIQGIALRMYRTPNWEILLTPNPENPGSYVKTARNRNGGNVEFDFVTGASVMLWDMTNLLNSKPEKDTASVLVKAGLKEIPKFDQQFAYDLGFYVGFGGSNLFKNFYIGPSFRFMDFFYLTAGVNVAEFEEMDEKYTHGEVIDASLTLDNITSKVWKVNAYISFNIDLDFLSYIKK